MRTASSPGRTAQLVGISFIRGDSLNCTRAELDVVADSLSVERDFSLQGIFTRSNENNSIR